VAHTLSTEVRGRLQQRLVSQLVEGTARQRQFVNCYVDALERQRPPHAASRLERQRRLER